MFRGLRHGAEHLNDRQVAKLNTQVLAYFDTSGMSNGGTEAIT